MAKKIEENFKREVAQFAISSGQPRAQVAVDFGVSLASVDRWVKLYGDHSRLEGSSVDLAAENKRLRRELQIAKQERDILKSEGYKNDPVNHFSRTTPRPSSRAKSDTLCVH